MSVDITVKLTGPLFSKSVDAVVKRAIVEEALDKVDERMERSARGRGEGRKRNTVTRERRDLVLSVNSTLIRPRTTGRAWTSKNMGIIKAMTPRVLRKVAQRAAEGLS